MKKTLLYIAAAALLFTTAGCTDYLDTKSSSVVDKEFVFSDITSARQAMNYGYQKFHDTRGLHMSWTLVWGSDIEDTQDTYNDGDASCQEKTFYPGGTENFNINGGDLVELFGQCYQVISICNSLIGAVEQKSNFDEIMTGEPNEWSDLYGQAVALRANMYWELVRHYGDVPLSLVAGEEAEGLTSRYAIMDYNIKKLREVEPHMYRVGENGHRADVMTRNFVQGLIGRLCLEDGGYSTRRTDLGDDFNVDGDGNRLSFDDWSVEKNNAIYGRRSDWRQLYEIAKQYLQACVDNPGTVVLHLTDPRSTGSNGEVYNNPFQYTFAQMHLSGPDNEQLADESVYEVPFEWNNGSDRPAYIGRPSTGSNGGAPCIACGQDRVQAWFYYGAYDPKDLRRDASVSVTGSDGLGHEQMQSFDRSDWGKGGGPGTNKWDWNRIDQPITSSYGTSGINTPYMRISDVYLMLAEVYAALGEDANARNYLSIVHNRNFKGGVDPNFEQFIQKNGSLLRAIWQERAFEFVGEGMRRFELVRTGLLPEAAVKDRQIMTAIVDGVEQNGYYTFENGNQLPAYIWTKMVDAKSEYGYRLTADTPEGKEDDPVLYPAYRGQNNNWTAVNATAATGETNVAIKGLFKYIAPGSAEAQELEAQGYVQTPWAVDMARYRETYATKLLAGYSDADFAAKNPPIHVQPFIYNDLSTSKITNGYGFRQQ